MKNFTPDQVRAMSVAEMFFAIDGFQEFNGGGKGIDPITPEDHESLERQFPSIPPDPGVDLLPEFRPDWDGKL